MIYKISGYTKEYTEQVLRPRDMTDFFAVFPNNDKTGSVAVHSSLNPTIEELKEIESILSKESKDGYDRISTAYGYAAGMYRITDNKKDKNILVSRLGPEEAKERYKMRVVRTIKRPKAEDESVNIRKVI